MNSEITLPEITIGNNKWAIFSAYRSPCNSNIKTFLGYLSNLLNKYLRKYDNDIIMGDFKIDGKDKINKINFDKFSRFCDTCSMSNQIKDYTCFPKTQKSSSDLILTNKEHSLQLTRTTETGVHLLLSIFMKSETTRLPTKQVMYRNFKKFNEKSFLDDVKLNNFSRISDDSNKNYKFLSYQFQSVVNKHALLKTKIVRGNNAPSVNKTLRKEICKRSAVRNKFLKHSSDSNWQKY